MKVALSSQLCMVALLGLFATLCHFCVAHCGSVLCSFANCNCFCVKLWPSWQFFFPLVKVPLLSLLAIERCRLVLDNFVILSQFSFNLIWNPTLILACPARSVRNFRPSLCRRPNFLWLDFWHHTAFSSHFWLTPDLFNIALFYPLLFLLSKFVN